MPSSPPALPSEQSVPATTSTPPPDVLQPPEQAPPPVSPPSSSDAPRTLRIGTRASALALAQVSIFTELLAPIHPTLATQTVPISVAGDRDKITDLHTLAQSGKSLWTEELEVLLLKGEIDCIVHSLKDVPTKVVAGCEVKIVGDRGERRDCVVFPRGRTERSDGVAPQTASAESSVKRKGEESASAASATVSASSQEPSPKKRKVSSTASTPRKLSELPPGSIVGTSSIRRAAMIRRRYPHLEIQDVRGNVGTRLRKVDDRAFGFDCLVMAGAGIQRIGLGDRVDEWLNPADGSSLGDQEGNEGMLHAVGQGAIGLEVREGDEWVYGLLEGKDGGRGVVVNRASWECQAERSLLRTLEGGCSVPVGVSCTWEDKEHERAQPEENTGNAMTSATVLEQSPRTNQSYDTSTGHDPHADSQLQFTSRPSTSSSRAPPTAPSDPQMATGYLHIRASVTSVDGTSCVSAARRQWISNDKDADEAGWEVARVLVEKGAGKILEGINLNRGMIERGDGA
ncbi:MAG: hypothetical protein Q9174_001192 [Haloplaca sp. 1 TL-2023]